MKHIVSFSGGKDSTAMLLMMVEQNIPIDEVVYYSMGSWEWDGMVEHIEKVKSRLPKNIKFTQLGNDEIIQKEFEKFGFPSFNIRWCTRVKVQALKKHLKQNYKKGGFVQYIGIAFDEKERAKKKWVKETDKFPLIEWEITESKALEYCYANGYDWKRFYEKSISKRMSCWCCPLQRIDELRNLFINYPEKWERLKKLEERNNCPYKFKGKKSFFRGATSVFDLEERFKKELKQPIQLKIKTWPKK